MASRRLLAIVLGVCVLAGAGCARQAALTELTPTDVFTGWYDFGVVNGKNKLVPSISFRLANSGSAPISHVQLLVSFWAKGDDGESDSKQVEGIGGTAVPPGAATDPILVRAGVGYTIEQPRAELFSHGEFRDFTAKVFAKQGGKIVPLGEHLIEHRIIPQTP